MTRFRTIDEFRRRYLPRMQDEIELERRAKDNGRTVEEQRLYDAIGRSYRRRMERRPSE